MKRSLLAIWAQVLAGLALHWLGAGVWFFLLPMQLIVHRQIIVRNAASVRELKILCANHVAAAALANMLAYNLYYLHIGHDFESLLVGRLGMWGAVLIVSAMSIISVLKWKENRK